MNEAGKSFQLERNATITLTGRTVINACPILSCNERWNSFYLWLDYADWTPGQPGIWKFRPPPCLRYKFRSIQFFLFSASHENNICVQYLIYRSTAQYVLQINSSNRMISINIFHRRITNIEALNCEEFKSIFNIWNLTNSISFSLIIQLWNFEISVIS